MGIGIIFGIGTGYLMRIFYVFNEQDFYKDEVYFEGISDEIQIGDSSKTKITDSIEYLQTAKKGSISHMLTLPSLKTIR